MSSSSESRSSRIQADLKKISPLALPQYLAECEFYDMQDTQQILDEAIEEFDDKGGLAGNLMEPVLSATTQSIALIFLKKFHQPTYDKVRKGKVNISNIIKQAINFKYPDAPDLNKASNLAYDNNQEIMHNRLKHSESNIDDTYNGVKNYRDTSENNRNTQFKDKQFEAGDEATDVLGNKVYSNKDTATTKTGFNNTRLVIGEADHVTPLKQIHDKFATFEQRYSNSDKIKELVNNDKNFQLLSGAQNAAKGGGMTNSEFISYSNKIEDGKKIKEQLKNDSLTAAQKTELKAQYKNLELNKTQKKNINKHLDIKTQLNDPNLSDKQKAELKEELSKYKLTKKQQDALKQKQKESESFIHKEMLKEGAKTTLLEQVGQIIEVMIGPVSFEIKDMLANGINHGFDSDDTLKCIGRRISRVFKYILKELPRLIGNLLGDFGQMLAHLAMSIFGVIKDIFGKFYDVVVNGLSLIKDAVKILLSKNSAVQKGNAICKLLVTFSVGVLGQFVIDKALNAIGIPDPFSEIVAAIASTVLSSVVIYYFDKADIFNIKNEIRAQRIKEIFDARIEQLKTDTSNFDIAVTEKLKTQRIQYEKLQENIDQSLKSNNMELLNKAVDGIADFLHIDIPYSNAAEFIQFVKNSKQIKIS